MIFIFFSIDFVIGEFRGNFSVWLDFIFLIRVFWWGYGKILYERCIWDDILVDLNWFCFMINGWNCFGIFVFVVVVGDGFRFIVGIWGDVFIFSWENEVLEVGIFGWEMFNWDGIVKEEVFWRLVVIVIGVV